MSERAPRFIVVRMSFQNSRSAIDVVQCASRKTAGRSGNSPQFSFLRLGTLLNKILLFSWPISLKRGDDFNPPIPVVHKQTKTLKIDSWKIDQLILAWNCGLFRERPAVFPRSPWTIVKPLLLPGWYLRKQALSVDIASIPKSVIAVLETSRFWSLPHLAIISARSSLILEPHFLL